MSTPRLDSIPTSKRGRPRTTRKAAADILGPAIVDTLAKADLYVVSGALLRELALIVGEAAPQAPSGGLDMSAISMTEQGTKRVD